MFLAQNDLEQDPKKAPKTSPPRMLITTKGLQKHGNGGRWLKTVWLDLVIIFELKNLHSKHDLSRQLTEVGKFCAKQQQYVVGIGTLFPILLKHF